MSTGQTTCQDLVKKRRILFDKSYLRHIFIKQSNLRRIFSIKHLLLKRAVTS